MKKRKYNKNDSDGKLLSYFTDNKVYCSNPNCNGYGVVFYHNSKDRKLCRNCGHWIYRSERIKLKYEMKERGVRVGNL